MRALIAMHVSPGGGRHQFLKSEHVLYLPRGEAGPIKRAMRIRRLFGRSDASGEAIYVERRPPITDSEYGVRSEIKLAERKKVGRRCTRVPLIAPATECKSNKENASAADDAELIAYQGGGGRRKSKQTHFGALKV